MRKHTFEFHGLAPMSPTPIFISYQFMLDRLGGKLSKLLNWKLMFALSAIDAYRREGKLKDGGCIRVTVWFKKGKLRPAYSIRKI